ncbi:putative inner membrane protein [Poriferisphaera corsica]|uniref:Putative inner membrane protein n=1 Tax=Poriferisphaera corsica TaxID=2528020 RepID=A0A517YQN5_9BACT|nr:YeeE/YedE thiosulfate transporter family protein [Poriferisphaera corsica]QDU32524.1 putative inner membrane protein [Poriferisphaera corsica]
MNNALRNRWNPYVVGIGIGVLSWIVFAGFGKAIGTSTTLAKTAGLATAIVAPQHVEANTYYAKYFNPPKKHMFDWQFFLVIAMPVGAYIAAKLARPTKPYKTSVPPLWEQRFGPSKLKRYTAAFLGGVIMLFGARMAGGCTSGHGISGGLQLALGSWTFFFAMFGSGVITAFLLFGLKPVSQPSI